MERNNDIALKLAIGAMVFASAGHLPAQGIIDCVSQPTIQVAHLRGRVIDPSGVVVPGVVVSLARGGKIIEETRTDNDGRFSFRDVPGTYELRTQYLNLRAEASTVRLGNDLSTLFHRGDLNVFLGLGVMCPFSTTSRKEMQNQIRNFKMRSQETTKNNATQK